MKKDQIIETRENGSRRVMVKCDHVKMTDQSFKKAVDINTIVAKFNKTGILPQGRSNPRFGDFSAVPKLEEAFDAVNAAKELFYDLPADLRKLLDNDPSKLESWLLNADNKELAIKYGLMEKEVDKTPIVADKDAQGGTNEPIQDTTTVSAS